MSKHEEGSTILDTLMALGIIGLVGVIILSLLSSSVKGIERARENLNFGVKLLMVDELIRLNMMMINIPYWDRMAALIRDNNYIEIPWFSGKSRSYLRFFWDEHSLGMESGNDKREETWFLLEDLDHADVSVLFNEQKLPYGLDIAYTYNGTEYHTKASFGSCPVRRKRP
jgi:hypothetical protein